MWFRKKSESEVDLYRRFRAAGKSLVNKLFELAGAPQFDMVKAARKLTLPMDGETLVFDSETDSSALADFFLHEMRYGGKRIVDLMLESGQNLPPDEKEVLDGYVNSRCSLFLVRSTDPVKCQMVLHDLLDPQRPDVTFMDINLSQPGSLPVGDLLFSRLVSCGGLTMGTGICFAFPAAQQIHLINSYTARMRTVTDKEKAQRSFVFFYQKNREMGREQAYVEVVP